MSAEPTHLEAVKVQEKNRTARAKIMWAGIAAVVAGLAGFFGGAATERAADKVDPAKDRIVASIVQIGNQMTAIEGRLTERMDKLESEIGRRLMRHDDEISSLTRDAIRTDAEVKRLAQVSAQQQQALIELTKAFSQQIPAMAASIASVAENVARIDERTKRQGNGQ